MIAIWNGDPTVLSQTFLDYGISRGRRHFSVCLLHSPRNTRDRVLYKLLRRHLNRSRTLVKTSPCSRPLSRRTPLYIHKAVACRYIYIRNPRHFKILGRPKLTRFVVRHSSRVADTRNTLIIRNSCTRATAKIKLRSQLSRRNY